MKEIKLTQGFVAQVDDEDYDTLMQWSWSVHRKKKAGIVYAQRGINRGTKILAMHRQIMNVTDSKIFVDHIDRNGLNNQKINLRLCNHSQNCCNRIPNRNSTSKYMGVCWSTNRKKWVAQIRKNGVSYHLGRFDNEKEAALAYNLAAPKFHGEFARLNIL